MRKSRHDGHWTRVCHVLGATGALVFTAILTGCVLPVPNDSLLWNDPGKIEPARSTSTTQPEAPVYHFPVKISANGRYFVDQDDKPIFWMGTTIWELTRTFTPEEAALALDRTKAAGFTFVQVMVLGRAENEKTGPNFRGDMPWINDDPLKPNEAYFQNVDTIFKLAQERGLVLTVTMYHQRLGKYITPENARAWARWLANRYKDMPNLIWAEHPKAQKSYLPVLRELAAGLKEGDGGRHLIGSKPDPSPFSSSFIHDEPWLAYNTIQTWKDVQLIYPMTKHDYDLKPVKPVIMGEGAYEDSDMRYGFEVTPLIIRRQAYYTYLAGGFHGFGQRAVTDKSAKWQAGLDSPGTKQMTVLKKIFTDLPEWWLLTPDQLLLAGGGVTEGKVLNLAARHAQEKWAVVYLAEKATVTVNLNNLAPLPRTPRINPQTDSRFTSPGNNVRVAARWIDPRSGASVPAGEFWAASLQAFSTPEGWEDAVLVMEAR